MSIGRRIFNCLELGTHHPEGRREGGTCRGKAPPRRQGKKTTRQNVPSPAERLFLRLSAADRSGTDERASVENRCYIIIIQSLTTAVNAASSIRAQRRRRLAVKPRRRRWREAREAAAVRAALAVKGNLMKGVNGGAIELALAIIFDATYG